MSIVEVGNDPSRLGIIHRALASLSHPESDLLSMLDRYIYLLKDGHAIKVTYTREGNTFRIQEVPATEIDDEPTALYFLPKGNAHQPSELEVSGIQAEGNE